MAFALSEPPSPRTSYTVIQGFDWVAGALALRGSPKCLSGDVINFINEGQRIIARETFWYEATIVGGTTSGVAEYSFPPDLLARVIVVRFVRFGDRTLGRTSLEELYNIDPEWRDHSNGTPTVYYIRGTNILGLYPTPSQSIADGIEIDVYALPPEVTDPEDYWYVPHGYESLLLDYAKWQLSLRDISGEGGLRVKTYEQQWFAGLEMIKRGVSTFDEHRIVQMGSRGSSHRPRGRGYHNIYRRVEPF